MKDTGFSILELLIVVAIIGLLAALAIPNYSLFKKNAFNASAESDVRKVIPAAELASASGGFPTPLVVDGSGGLLPPLEGATTSPGVLGFVAVDPNSFFIELGHTSGDLTYQFDSDAGWAIVEN